VTAALVGFGSYVWGGEALAGGGVADTVSEVATTQASSAGLYGSSFELAATSGIGYAGASSALGPGGMDAIQLSYFGEKLSTGKLASKTPSNSILRQLSDSDQRLQIQAPLKQSLTAERNLYQGRCEDGFAKSLCSSRSLGVVPRRP
jgi:hypothetical protein